MGAAEVAPPPGFELDAETPPLPPGFEHDSPAAPATPTAAPAQPPSSNLDVLSSAAYKGAAGVPDMVLNTPTNILNLGKAAIGTLATAAGRPDLAPALTQNPDLIARLFEKMGFIKPGVIPQGAVQKMIDTLTQGAVGGALTGGASIPRALAGAGTGALAAGAAGATQEATEGAGGSEALQAALGNTAGLLAPRGLAAPATVARKAIERTPDIPPERVTAYREMTAKGARPTGGSLIYGEPNKNIKGQQKVANETWNESVGLPKKSDFGQAEFRQATDNIAADYKRILTGQNVTLDRTLAQQMKDMYDRQVALGQMGASFIEARPIIDTMDKLLQQSGTGTVQIPALEYNSMRSMLGRDAHAARNDPTKAAEYTKVQRALDAAADRSLPPPLAKELKETRGRYENLMILSDAAQGHGAGFITPAQVGKTVASRQGHGSVFEATAPLKRLGRQGLSLSGDAAIDSPNLSGVAGHLPKVGISLNAIKRGIETPVTALRARGMGKPGAYENALAAEKTAKETASRAALPLEAVETSKEADKAARERRAFDDAEKEAKYQDWKRKQRGRP